MRLARYLTQLIDRPRQTVAVAAPTLLSFATPRVGAQHYYVYVASESEDEVALVHFDGVRAEVEQVITVGVWPAEIEGPHGLALSPDGRYWFVSVAHGNPYGVVYKYETATNAAAGKTELGLFPATMSISPATGLLYVANFNLHGDMMPSTVSVVDPYTMTELNRTETGIMPHGGRFSPDGMRHYSVSMMDGFLHEIDAVTFKVRRSLKLDQPDPGSDDHAAHDDAAMENHVASSAHSAMKPTWASPHPKKPLVYVAANGLAKVLEVNVDTWTVDRVFETAKGPYNIDISPDGRWLVVTYKGAASTGVWDLERGESVATVSNSRAVTHGVAISDDSRYAFVSVEAIGSEPGSVDVIDLATTKRVASVDVGKQAGGIVFWTQSAEEIELPKAR